MSAACALPPRRAWEGRSQALDASGGQARLSIDPGLETALRLMYELKFDSSRAQLASWERSHPTQPMGLALEAASFLFEEFYKKGVLTSEFFLDDKRLLGGIEGKPDPDLESAFLSAARRSEEQARRQLALNEHDPDSLLALTLLAGMRADNSSLIEKRHLQTMALLREAERRARDLLSVAPEAADAFVAMGAANYIVGCMPAYKRFFLRLGGVQGDKLLGMQQLRMAAANGVYLRPFAQLLLGLAALREMDTGLARREFTSLAMEFPSNPLFARELSKLEPYRSSGGP